MYTNRLNYSVLKKLIIFPFLVFSVLPAFTQVSDFNKIVPDENTRPKTFEDYLVQLAWKNSPQNKILTSNQKISEVEVDLTKREWMEYAQLQYNLNEISLSNLIYDYEDPLFVALPIWNATATIKLSTIFNRKKNIDISKQQLEITKQNINIMKLSIRANVLERYYSFELAKDILKVATEAEQDASENHILLKALFKEDKADFEELNRASLAFTNAKRSRVEAEMEIQLTKIALEELIGVRYEVAEKYGKSYKKELE